MFRLIVLTLFICGIRAIHRPYYDYGFNKFFTGLKRGGIDSYNTYGYDDHYGSKYNHNYGSKYGNNYGYGYGYGYQTPYSNVYFVKRLPPIIKNVKQPVFIEQPVIINKIPVIKKRKEVTVKNLPPIVDVKEPTIVEKDVGVGVIPVTQKKPHLMPELDVKPVFGGEKPVIDVSKHLPKDKTIDLIPDYPKNVKEMIPFEGMPGLGGAYPGIKDKMPAEYIPDMHKGMKEKIPIEVMPDIKHMPKDIIPGVDYEGQKEKGYEVEDEAMIGKRKKEEMIDTMDVMHKEMMKEEKKTVGVEDDGFGDFDPNEFDVKKSEKLNRNY